MKISNAAKEANTCTVQMGITSLGGILPAAAKVMVRAGFTVTVLKRKLKRRTSARAPPMARGLPVTKTMYAKKRVDKNSAK